MGTITQKENDIFLHMGCDNELAKKVATEAGAVVLEWKILSALPALRWAYRARNF